MLDSSLTATHKHRLAHSCIASPYTVHAQMQGRQKVAEAQASTHTPTFTLLFLSKQPQAQRMSMSMVWADILSHKESGWRHMPLQQPPVRFALHASTASCLITSSLWCTDRHFFGLLKPFLFFLSTLTLQG